MAWDISQFTYDSVAFGFSDIGTSIYIKNDGTSFYVVAVPGVPTGDHVVQCSMSIGWDLTTASVTSTFNLPTSTFNQNLGIFFKDDGTKMYIVQKSFAAGHFVNQYTLSVPWDVTTASSSATFNIDAQFSIIAFGGLFFKSDGTSMYIADSFSGGIFQYNLSSAWDITSSTYSTNFIDATRIARGFFIKPDGTKLYSCTGLTAYQFSFGTPWNISTLSYDSVSLVTNPVSDGAEALSIKSTGDKIIFIGETNSNAYQFSIPGPAPVTVQENVFLSFSDTSGNVQQLNAGKTDNTAVINYELETQEIEFGDRFHLKKTADEITAFCDGASGSQLIATQNEQEKSIPMDLSKRVNVGKDINLEGNFFTFKWSGSTSTSQPVFEGIQLENVTDQGMTYA